MEKAYEAALFTKPRDEKGKEKEISLEDKEKLLITHIEVDEAELQQLAALRGQMIMDYMADSGRVAPERIFILSAAPVQDDQTLEGAVKVLFELK